jgi:rhodanese-related sulfurtransferase
MKNQIRINVQEMVAKAEAEIQTITAAEALAMQGDPQVVMVDLRDVRELRHGFIPGSFHAPRGMLEFWVDPDCPYFHEIFASGKRFVFYCNLGWRSALATKAVQDMGLTNVCHLGGGIEAWKEAGGPLEYKERKEKENRAS